MNTNGSGCVNFTTNISVNTNGSSAQESRPEHVHIGVDIAVSPPANAESSGPPCSQYQGPSDTTATGPAEVHQTQSDGATHTWPGQRSADSRQASTATHETSGTSATGEEKHCESQQCEDLRARIVELEAEVATLSRTCARPSCTAAKVITERNSM